MAREFKMKQPPTPKQSFSSSDKLKIVLVSVALAILLLIFGLLLGIMLRQSGFRLSTLVERLPAMPNIGLPSTGPTAVMPTVVIPTQDCGSPTLVLGTTTFQIQNLTPAADGSLNVPSDTSGIAYWVEGTNSNYVFVLPPMPENLAAMDTITVGSPATATWRDCSLTSYSLSAPQQSSFESSALPDQSQDGITIFFQTDPSGASFVFSGGLAEQSVDVIDTPMSDESGVLAEISLLETSPSSDGMSINVDVSIRNYGQTAFTLTSGNVTLTHPDGTPLTLVGSKPRLPEKISSGETQTFEFTFSRPSTPTATLKIFTVEYDIEGY
jgi:hypothetical protein